MSSAMSHPTGGLVDFAIEDKLDGERLLVHRTGSTIKCFTRNTRDYTAIYGPLLRDAVVEGVRAENVVLDGEVMAFDRTSNKYLRFGENKTVASNELDGLGGTKTLCYVVFDILWVERPEVTLTREGDMTRLPLAERRRLLEAILPPSKRVVGKLTVLGMQVVRASSGKAARAAAVEARLVNAIEDQAEGIVIKSLASPYVCNAKERLLWLKIKPEYMAGSYDTLDVLIVGAYLGKGRAGHARSGEISSFVVAVADRTSSEGPAGPTAPVAKRWQTVGRVATGINHDTLHWLRSQLKPLMSPLTRGQAVGSIAPYMREWNPLANTRPDFVVTDPSKSIVLEVCAAELQSPPTGTRSEFSSGVALRFPRIETIRHDKAPQSTATMDDIREIVRNTSGKLSSMAAEPSTLVLAKRDRSSRGGTVSLSPSKLTVRVHGESSEAKLPLNVFFGACPASTLQCCACLRHADRHTLATEVVDQAAESSQFAGVEVVVYDQSFEWADLVAEDDEHVGPGPDVSDAKTFISMLLKRMGATISLNPVATTTLAVGMRGHRVETHKAYCQKGKGDLDIVSPSYIQACARAGERLDPLPHEHIVFASSATRERLHAYTDEAGDHFSQPLTVSVGLAAVLLCGWCHLWQAIKLDLECTSRCTTSQARRFALIAKSRSSPSASTPSASVAAARTPTDAVVSEMIASTRTKLRLRPGMPASRAMHPDAGSGNDEEGGGDEAETAARTLVRCSQRFRPWLGHTVFVASKRTGDVVRKDLVTVAALSAGATVVDGGGSSASSASIVVDCDGTPDKPGSMAEDAVARATARGERPVVVHVSGVPGIK